jgi:hypothetical protein
MASPPGGRLQGYDKQFGPAGNENCTGQVGQFCMVTRGLVTFCISK